MNKLNVQAIFCSIDGEVNGFDGAGQLTTFIRLKGCNLRCHYCDTVYAQNPEPKNLMTVDEIIEQVHFPKVTITGGSPLFQNIEDLVKKLSDLNKDITVETNGSYPIFGSNFNVRWVVDFKLPSSGMTKHMNSSAFSNLREIDIIKFVISDEEDYRYAKMVIEEHLNPSNCKARKVFSPAIEIKHVYATDTWGEFEQFGTVIPKRLCIVDTKWPRQLAEMMMNDKVDAQFSLQIHKILWPDAKEER